jgi:hypothetical protein
VLEGVALQNACGALQVEGDPGGVIYLDKGQITYAQSDWTPDLRARLLGTLRSADDLRELVTMADQPAGNLGELLIERGHVSADQLTTLLHSVIVDAIIALTVPLADEASVAGMRLVAGQAHWAGAFTRLAIGAVRAEAISRAELMATRPVPRSSRLELCDLGGGSAVLTGAQWALAFEMSGAFSAKDLAWAAGFSMYETVSCLGDLVAAGLCAPCPPAKSALAVPTGPVSLDPGPVSESPAVRTPNHRAASRAASTAQPIAGSSPGARPMPRRKPGEFVAVAQAAAAALAEAEAGSPGATAKAAEPVPSRQAGVSESAGSSVGADAGAQAGAGNPGDASGSACAAPLLVETEFTHVPVDSLRRVLEGLRKLS